MSESFLNKAGDDLLRPPRVNDTCSKSVPARDGLTPSNVAESNGLNIAWFEPDRCTSGDIQSLPVGPGAIEGQKGVGFDEVVV